MQEVDFCLSLRRSGTHGLNEELGRHRGRKGKTECSLCGDECENVSHVLSYVLHSELWESKFGGLLSLVKKYAVDMWKIRKHKFYDNNSEPGQLNSQSSPENLAVLEGQRDGKFCQNGN